MSPVASFGFSVPGTRGATLPSTSITSSWRSVCAIVGQLRIFLGTENDLGQSFAIAQIDENDAAMIAPDMDPAGEFGGAADVGSAQLVAMMCPIHVAVLAGARLALAAAG